MERSRVKQYQVVHEKSVRRHEFSGRKSKTHKYHRFQNTTKLHHPSPICILHHTSGIGHVDHVDHVGSLVFFFGRSVVFALSFVGSIRSKHLLQRPDNDSSELRKQVTLLRDTINRALLHMGLASQKYVSGCRLNERHYGLLQGLVE